MLNRRSLFVAAALLVSASPAFAQDKLQDKFQSKLIVVASFSILGDLVKNVGGDRVNVSTLVPPGGDAHVYTPTPADAKRLVEAQLVVVNGLGFEGWLSRLVKASGGRMPVITATTGIKPRKLPGDHGHGHGHSHGEADPHAWQSVANVRTYVTNIREALIAADSAGAAIYRANADAYFGELDKLDREVKEAVAKLPAERRKVISTHDAFGYFADAYGITFIAPQGVSTESEASAKDIAAIIRQIKAQKIPAVFLENVTDPRLMRRIASETGAAVGGTLYSDSLTDEKGDAPTYIGMVRHNIKALTSALTN